jgi:hypothetical protein
MKSYEEINQQFRSLLKSIENNNKLYFQQPDSIYKSYNIIKVKGSYTIKVFASLPKSIVVMIESAFLNSCEYTPGANS